MELKICKENDLCVVEASGWLALDETSLFRDQMKQYTLDDSIKWLIVDMELIRCIDSQGLATLVILFNLMNKRNGYFALSSVNGTPKQVIEMTCVNKIIPMFDSVRDAMIHLAPHIMDTQPILNTQPVM